MMRIRIVVVAVLAILAGSLAVAAPSEATRPASGYSASSAITWPWLEGLGAAGSSSSNITGWASDDHTTGSTPHFGVYPGPWYGINDATELNYAALVTADGCSSSISGLTTPVESPTAGSPDNRTRLSLLGDSTSSELLWEGGGGPLSVDPIFRWTGATNCGQPLSQPVSGGQYVRSDVLAAVDAATMRTGKALVVGLGINDTSSGTAPTSTMTQQWRQAISDLVDRAITPPSGTAIPCVAWVNLVTQFPDANRLARTVAFNQQLTDVASARPALRIIDWDAEVRRHPEYLLGGAVDGSGVHLTRAGIDAQANLIRAAVSTCSSVPAPATPLPGPVTSVAITPGSGSTATVSWSYSGPTATGFRVRTNGITPVPGNPNKASFAVTRYVAAVAGSAQSVTVNLSDLAGLEMAHATVEAVNASGMGPEAESTLAPSASALGAPTLVPVGSGRQVTTGRPGGATVRRTDGRHLWLFGSTTAGSTTYPSTGALTSTTSSMLELFNPAASLQHSFLDPLPVTSPGSVCSGASGTPTSTATPVDGFALPQEQNLPAGHTSDQRIAVFSLNSCSATTRPAQYGVGTYTYVPNGFSLENMNPTDFKATTATESLFPVEQHYIAGTPSTTAPAPGVLRRAVTAFASSSGDLGYVVLCEGRPTVSGPGDLMGCRLVRIDLTPTTGTLDHTAASQYLYYDMGSWRSDVDESAPLLLPSGTDPTIALPSGDVSVRFVPSLKRYVMAYSSSTGQLVVRQSVAPEGPWSLPAALPLAGCTACTDVQIQAKASLSDQLVVTAREPSSGTTRAYTFTSTAFVAPTCTPAAPSVVGSAATSLTVSRAACAVGTPGASDATYRLRAFPAGSSTALDRIDLAHGESQRTVPGDSNQPPFVPGTAYQFTASAQNAAGEGPQSALSGAAVPPFASVGTFATRQYTDFTGVAPTTTESNTWSSAITSGTTAPAEEVTSLMANAYTDAKLSPVTRLYHAYFQRLPDPSGFDYWARKRREDGTTAVTISANFATSSEFINEYGNLSNQDFVELIYHNVLGRAGDAAGVAYWTTKINNGTKSRQQVMLEFSESDEHILDLTHTVEIVNLFYNMLSNLTATPRVPKVPTQTDVDTWDGLPRTGLVNDILGRSTYSARSGVTTTAPADPILGSDDLFTRFDHAYGWLGGDGGYSVRLPNGRDLWMFGDSGSGYLSSNASPPIDDWTPRTTPIDVLNANRQRQVGYLHNSAVITESNTNRFDTLIGSPLDPPPTSPLPFLPSITTGTTWGAGMVVEGTGTTANLRVFASDVGARDTDVGGLCPASDPDPAKRRKTDVARRIISLPVSSLVTSSATTSAAIPRPIYTDSAGRCAGVYFGNTVVAVSGTTYIYGAWSQPDFAFNSKTFIVKVPSGQSVTNTDAWQYWTTGGWVDPAVGAALPTNLQSIADEATNSVMRTTSGKYLMFVLRHWSSNPTTAKTIAVYSSNNATGPWDTSAAPIRQFVIPNDAGLGLTNYTTYLPQAHPDITKPGSANEILLSWSNDAVAPEGQPYLKYAYRPRFTWFDTTGL